MNKYSEVYKTVVDCGQVSRYLSDPDWVIIDCRFDLDDIRWEYGQYQNAHIARPVYAHINDDLSGEILSGRTSRHPLPSIERFTTTLSEWGVDTVDE
jgi:thiosulfate/3-mercaptopyruvate sulfurtransferase